MKFVRAFPDCSVARQVSSRSPWRSFRSTGRRRAVAVRPARVSAGRGPARGTATAASAVRAPAGTAPAASGNAPAPAPRATARSTRTAADADRSARSARHRPSRAGPRRHAGRSEPGPAAAYATSRPVPSGRRRTPARRTPVPGAAATAGRAVPGCRRAAARPLAAEPVPRVAGSAPARPAAVPAPSWGDSPAGTAALPPPAAPGCRPVAAPRARATCPTPPATRAVLGAAAPGPAVVLAVVPAVAAADHPARHPADRPRRQEPGPRESTRPAPGAGPCRRRGIPAGPRAGHTSGTASSGWRWRSATAPPGGR
jgi:hypothetical protein